MKKRKIVIGAALVLIVALIAGVTLAAFSGEAHVTNIITTGTISITLNDQMSVNGTAAKVVTDAQGNTTSTLTGVMPGVSVDKVVSVQNDGTGDAWIRVKVATTIKNAAGNALPDTITHNGRTESAVQIAFNTTGENAKWFAEVDASGNNTGYYYYKLPVAGKTVGGAAAATSDLFDTVMLNAFLPNSYQGCTVNIAVSAQAVQVKNNDSNGTLTELDSTNYTSVLGWPTD